MKEPDYEKAFRQALKEVQVLRHRERDLVDRLWLYAIPALAKAELALFNANRPDVANDVHFMHLAARGECGHGLTRDCPQGCHEEFGGVKSA